MESLALALVLLVVRPGSPVQGSTAAVEVEARAAQAVERLRALQERRRIPGLAAAVGVGGEEVWAGAVGVVDLERGAALDADAVFPIGSTSKALTALLLGQLVEAGKLDLDAPIERYVPYFPPKEHPLTARQLAGHLAGIRNYQGDEYDNRHAFASVAEAVEIFKDDPLLFEPGTRHAYSVYGFVLLSAALEGASGKSYLELVEQRLTAPLGLARTGPQRADTPGLVTCYRAGFRGVPTLVPPGDLSNKWAAGGLVSTPRELVKLGNAVLADQVVRRKTFELLATPQRLADGSDSGAGYGMGLRSGNAKLSESGPTVRVVHHGGTAAGAMSFFVLLPEHDLVVSLQGNLLFEPFTEFAAVSYALAELFLPPAREGSTTPPSPAR